MNLANVLVFIATLILAFFSFGKRGGFSKVIYMLMTACISTLLFHQFWSGLFSKAWTVWSTPMPSPTESNLPLAIMLTDLRNEVVSRSNLITGLFYAATFVAIIQRVVDGFLFFLIVVCAITTIPGTLSFSSPLHVLIAYFALIVLALIMPRKPKLS